MSLPHVLLGLLSRGPASGWDLKSRMARDLALGWDAELTQIYPALRRLSRGGFVVMKRRRSQKGPPRREYRLTPAGRREFLEWLAEPLETPRPRDASLARLAFLERQQVTDVDGGAHRGFTGGSRRGRVAVARNCRAAARTCDP